MNIFSCDDPFAPFFGKLNPNIREHQGLYLDREAEMSRAINKLKRFYKTHPDSIRLLAGPPGCGKTTFMKYLAKELPNAYYISLNEIARFSKKRINNDDYMTLFAQIELIIDKEAKGKRIPYSIEKDFTQTGIWTKYIKQRSFDFSLHEHTVKTFLTSILTKLDNSLEKRFKNPVYLLIDNVDLIHIQDQEYFLFILAYIVNHTNAVEVIYATRPEGVALSNQMPRGKHGRETNELLSLEMLDVSKVISSRFVAEKKDFPLDVFFAPETINLINELSDSNVPLGFKDVNKALHADSDLTLPVSKDKFIELCLGRSEMSSTLPDIYAYNNFNVGKVPALFLMLLNLETPTWIDKKFQTSYTEKLYKFSNRRRNTISATEINKILNLCRGRRLVRRVAVLSPKVLVKSLASGGDLFGFKIALTSRGKALLTDISQTNTYRDWSSFDNLPRGIQDKIKKHEFGEVISMDASYDWF